MLLPRIARAGAGPGLPAGVPADDRGPRARAAQRPGDPRRQPPVLPGQLPDPAGHAAAGGRSWPRTTISPAAGREGLADPHRPRGLGAIPVPRGGHRAAQAAARGGARGCCRTAARSASTRRAAGPATAASTAAAPGWPGWPWRRARRSCRSRCSAPTGSSRSARRLPRPGRVTVRFGAPLLFAATAGSAGRARRDATDADHGRDRRSSPARTRPTVTTSCPAPDSAQAGQHLGAEGVDERHQVLPDVVQVDPVEAQRRVPAQPARCAPPGRPRC